MSLNKNTAVVECLSFDAEEEILAAGLADGFVKLWDLQQQGKAIFVCTF